ncbi:hypothetical protein ACH5RR_007767 [Cinchona calisaya]|uniref:Pentatricopeptide repeat-containing protein-mitochondrial domain-containing protein n=1 Tax=Cinchona calisaya TaxID=153742 RepID=A0ABD3AD15_9GENT
MKVLHRLSRRSLRLTPIVGNTTRYVSTGSQTSIAEPPSSAHYDHLINQAGRDRDFDAVQHLLTKRLRDGCFNTNNTFKFISSDLSVLDNLLKSLAGLNHGFVKKSAHECLINQLSKLHRITEALHVAEIMVRNNYGADACTFHPILIALAKKKHTDEAWRVVQVLRDCGIKPDLTAYNYLLTAHCFAGDLTSAAYVLTKMEEEGMGADTRTYDALVLGACRAGRIDGALMILRRMLDDGVSPLYCTHVHVMNAMLRNGYYAQAVEFVMSYAGKDRGLDSENFGILASRLVKLNRLDEAKLVVKEMSIRGISMGDKLKDFYLLHVAN